MEGERRRKRRALPAERLVSRTQNHTECCRRFVRRIRPSPAAGSVAGPRTPNFGALVVDLDRVLTGFWSRKTSPPRHPPSRHLPRSRHGAEGRAGCSPVAQERWHARRSTAISRVTEPGGPLELRPLATSSDRTSQAWSDSYPGPIPPTLWAASSFSCVTCVS